MNRKRQILLIIISAVFIQLIVIFYTHFKEIYPIDSFLEFVVRLTYGSLLSSIFIAIIFYINRQIIKYLNIKYDWQQNTSMRVALELLISLIVSFAVSVSVTGISHMMFPYEKGLMYNILNNFFIIAVINIIFLSIMEAYSYFIEWNREKLRAEELNKENIKAKYDILKSQINPHFLFNSLNVLSSLIETEPEKASLFTEKLSDMYRYILNKMDSPVVVLKEEIEFAQYYIDLQNIRHENKVNVSLQINTDTLNKYVIPLSIQMILENCFKHNIISKDKRLNIIIYDEENSIIIKNNYQPKNTYKNSTGLGLKNLKKRYELSSSKQPEFYLKNNDYFAILPLIDIE